MKIHMNYKSYNEVIYSHSALCNKIGLSSAMALASELGGCQLHKAQVYQFQDKISRFGIEFMLFK